jgi:ubiquinone/menaquinone biosynthesis C-methylase UbiE
MTPLDRARYTVGQGLRIGFYAAHYLAARRMSAPFTRPGEAPFAPKAPAPPTGAARRAFFQLFADDLAAIEEGLYPPPRTRDAQGPLGLLARSRDFLLDVENVDRRRLARAGVEARDIPGAADFPVYYRQNFHFQSGGWLTADSAARYDFQVETLFAGAADAMRRAALAALARAIRGQDQRRVRLLDLACGAGRFIGQVREAFPRMPITGLDLSPAYLDAARARHAGAKSVSFVQGDAADPPLGEGGFDAITCIYLFHELPPRERRRVAAAIARLLAPGGVLILTDSLQTGDNPALDAMLEYFPEGFHEPYFTSYLTEDLDAVFAAEGLTRTDLRLAFLTRVATFRKAGPFGHAAPGSLDGFTGA